MTSNTATIRSFFAGWGSIILVGFIHLLDVFTRYRGGGINFYTWTIFFVIYAIIALRFRQRYRDDWRAIIVCFALSALVMPLAYMWIGNSYAFGGMLMVFNPVWIIYLLFWHEQDYPRMSFLYMVFWIALLAFSFMPMVQDYAGDQGYMIPNVSPATAISYMTSSVVQGWFAFTEAIVGIQETVVKETTRSIKIASGDYYTGEVDKGAEKMLGVFLEPLKAAQPKFYAGDPVTVYSTLRAETIAEPLTIQLKCVAEGKGKAIAANKIIPDDKFKVETLEEAAIDCIFDNLNAEHYTFKLTADFTFSTRAYQRAYLIEKDLLREYRRENIDPLEDFPDKKPSTVYTQGPIMIGIGQDVATQPVGIYGPASGIEQGPTLGVTIDNVWLGKLTKLKNLVLFVPKGIEVTDINGISVEATICEKLLDADAAVCDDAIVNAYTVPESELNKINKEKDIIAYTFRAHTKISDYNALMGQDTIAIKNFKVSAKYEYSYSTQRAMSVESERE
ncbi:hypothetical protein KY333_02280 [Candidatus Woesearchaeota archaeon]|nr:hypothetical protein [Candidatus Woesearchaeota archaeon]MBW2993789.1 hypothetical protein [Candidatus Woesearchaeota archaeon]